MCPAKLQICSGAAIVLTALFCLPAFAQETPGPPEIRPTSLWECIEIALLQNHDLQIERLNPEVARLTLGASYGYYDPLLVADFRQESASDSGGFDPADFSRDAIYTAESEVGKTALTGFLPGGMSYALSGSYAHSQGSRNFLNFDSYNLGLGVWVQQPLLRNFWIDQGRMTIRINRKNLKITELGVAYLTMDVINQVQQAYYELLYAHANLEIQQQLRSTRAELLAGIKRKVAMGTLAAPDESLAQTQLAQTEAQVTVARNLVSLGENALRSLLGDYFTNRLGSRFQPNERLLVVPELFSVAESWQAGLRQRPDLAQLQQDVEKCDIDLKYRRNQLFPSLNLVAGYGRRGASVQQVYPPFQANASRDDAIDQIRSGANPSDMVGAVLTVPLTLTAERANYRSSKLAKAQALLRLKQKQELVMREIADALDTASSNLERVQAVHRATDYARETLEAEERKLAGGKSTVFFVLQFQGDLALAQSGELRAKADYNRSLSQLHFAEGSLLARNRISLEFE